MENEFKLFHKEEIGVANDSMPHKLLSQFFNPEESSAFIYDIKDDRLVFMGRSINKITGYSSSFYMGKGFLFFKTLIHPSDFSYLVCSMITFLHLNGYNPPNAINSVTCRMKHAKKSWINVKVNVVKIDGSLKGRSTRVIGYIEKVESMRIQNKPSKANKITAREKEVLQLIASGDSAKIIAIKLNIGVNTVASHRKNLKKKLMAKNTAELIKKAINEDIL